MFKFKNQRKEDLIWNISPTLEIVAGLFFYITQFRRKLHPVLESILQGQIKTWNGMMWHDHFLQYTISAKCRPLDVSTIRFIQIFNNVAHQ